MECLRLRVKDVDLGYNQIVIRHGKGEKDRIRFQFSRSLFVDSTRKRVSD